MQCAVHADSFGDDDADDAAAAGVTGSVPDLSMMRLDSSRETRCAALAHSTGDAASPTSKTSSSGDAGAVSLLQPAQQPDPAPNPAPAHCHLSVLVSSMSEHGQNDLPSVVR